MQDCQSQTKTVATSRYLSKDSFTCNISAWSRNSLTMIPLLRNACGRVWNRVANDSAAVGKESLHLANSVVGQGALSAYIRIHTINACVTRTQVTLKIFFSCPSLVPSCTLSFPGHLPLCAYKRGRMCHVTCSLSSQKILEAEGK